MQFAIDGWKEISGLVYRRAAN